MLQAHTEQHFTASETVRDIVIGMADGLTVPFALAAGLSGAVNATGVVIAAGLAEVAAGSIAMGLGGYLAAKTDAEHYESERQREERETIEMPEEEAAEVEGILKSFGLDGRDGGRGGQIDPGRSRAVGGLYDAVRIRIGGARTGPGVEKCVDNWNVLRLRGMVPLLPYFFCRSVQAGVVWSVVVNLLALTVFGYIKGRVTTPRPARNAVQTVVVGGLAAAAAFGIAKLVG